MLRSICYLALLISANVADGQQPRIASGAAEPAGASQSRWA